MTLRRSSTELHYDLSLTYKVLRTGAFGLLAASMALILFSKVGLAAICAITGGSLLVIAMSVMLGVTASPGGLTLHNRLASRFIPRERVVCLLEPMRDSKYQTRAAVLYWDRDGLLCDQRLSFLESGTAIDGFAVALQLTAAERITASGELEFPSRPSEERRQLTRNAEADVWDRWDDYLRRRDIDSA